MMKSTVNVELKECPFCGNHAKLIYDKGSYKVFCSSMWCLAAVGWGNDRDEVVANWNKRIPN